MLQGCVYLNIGVLFVYVVCLIVLCVRGVCGGYKIEVHLFQESFTFFQVVQFFLALFIDYPL